MHKFGDVSIGAMVALVLLLGLEIQYYIDNNNYTHVAINQIDKNGDGIITRKELKQHLLNIEKKRKFNNISSTDIAKSIISGVIRGFIMGLILNSFEGGVVLGLILGTVNPIILGSKSLI